MTEPRTLRLSGECGLRAVRGLHREIAHALRDTSRLEIDCSDAHGIDIAFIQLVVAAAKTARREDGQLRLLNLSEPGQSAFRRAGVPLPGTPDLLS